ncbi:MAG TPA: GNAT family N-acetyltransferase [Paracoccaceae bacterium]|nr:GNAT family N-acetyltransferase [Paracoccaceae bacterium]
MTVMIRPHDPASPQALACLRAFFADLDAAFPDGFDPGPVAGWGLDDLRPPGGLFLIAEGGTEALGCVGLRRHDPATAEVKRLWVRGDQRGTGLARHLMARVEDGARAGGCTRLVLDTSRHLPAAVAFYRRAGWAEIARYNDNAYAHHFFARAL